MLVDAFKEQQRHHGGLRAAQPAGQKTQCAGQHGHGVHKKGEMNADIKAAPVQQKIKCPAFHCPSQSADGSGENDFLPLVAALRLQ